MSNPRIGDFGLATSGKYYAADSTSNVLGEVDSDMTRSIGTAMYVAPELRSNMKAPYSEKVDVSVDRLCACLKFRVADLPLDVLSWRDLF